MQDSGRSLDGLAADALDRRLWERAAERDGEALCELFDLRAPAVLGVLVKALNRKDAEEVLQEVFDDFWKETADPGSLHGSRPFHWLLGRARIRAAERLVRARRQSAPATRSPRQTTGGFRLADIRV